MTATVRGISVRGRGGDINQSGHKTFFVIYKVYTNDKEDGPAIVRVASGIPSIGDTYSAGNDSDANAVCVNKRVIDTESPYDWEVECEFTTDPGAYEPSQFDNPLDQPAELSFGFETRRILVPGRFNNPVGPSGATPYDRGIYAPNGELFDPQPEVDIHDPVWFIKKNVSAGSFTYEGLMKLANCVNSDTYNGAFPRQLRFKPPTAVRKWHKNTGYYWELSYALVYRFETWDIQLLNQGTYYFPSGTPSSLWGTTALRHVKVDSQFNVVTVNLTTNGDINNTSVPTFTRIRFFREIPFSTLNLL